MTYGMPDRKHEPCIYLFKEDMQSMAADAWAHGKMETGSSLFGFRTHGDNIAVMMVLGAAPNAIHGGAHFKDDPDHIMRASEFLFENYGLQYVGSEHSHQWLRIRSPSSVDCDQSQRLAIRNDYTQLIQLIITYEKEPPGPGNCVLRSKQTGKVIADKQSPGLKVVPATSVGARYNEQVPFVRINAHYYADAKTGSYVSSKIKVLKGKNPIRRSLSAIRPVPFIGSLEKLSFPMDRIIFDEFVASTVEQQEPRMPEVLADRLKVLPEDVLVGSEVTVNHDSLIVMLPLPREHMLTLTIGMEDEYPINKLLIAAESSDKPQEIICQIVKPLASDDLSRVYKWAQMIVCGNGRNNSQSDNFGWIA